MKNVKTKLIMLIAITATFLGCNKEDLKAYSRNDNSLNNTAVVPVVRPIIFPANTSGAGYAVLCFIDGQTVTNATSINPYSTVLPGSSTSYSYYSNLDIVALNWTVVAAVPAGSITISNTNVNNVTVTFSADFVSGRLKASGTGARGSACGPSIEIRK